MTRSHRRVVAIASDMYFSYVTHLCDKMLKGQHSSSRFSSISEGGDLTKNPLRLKYITKTYYQSNRILLAIYYLFSFINPFHLYQYLTSEVMTCFRHMMTYHSQCTCTVPNLIVRRCHFICIVHKVVYQHSYIKINDKKIRQALTSTKKCY